jgi:hypothetical protein
MTSLLAVSAHGRGMRRAPMASSEAVSPENHDGSNGRRAGERGRPPSENYLAAIPAGGDHSACGDSHEDTDERVGICTDGESPVTLAPSYSWAFAFKAGRLSFEADAPSGA